MVSIVGGKATGHYRFRKRLYGLADTRVGSQSEIDRALNSATKAWQDDIIIVTRGMPEEKLAELEAVLEKLKQNGHGVSVEKTKFFQSEAHGVGTRSVLTELSPDKREQNRS